MIVLAVAEPPLKLFEVAVQVLLADKAPATSTGPNSLDGVGVNHPILHGVVDRLMLGVMVGEITV